MQPSNTNATKKESDKDKKNEYTLESLERRIRAKIKTNDNEKHKKIIGSSSFHRAEQAAELDRRIDAKRLANTEIGWNSDQSKYDSSNKEKGDTEEIVHNECGGVFHEQSTNNASEVQDAEMSYPNMTTDVHIMEETAQEGTREDESGGIQVQEQSANNASEVQEAEVNYPNVRTDSYIMEEIAQEGIQVDESGGIQAFVADPIALDEAAVIGFIKSDEEVELEERKEYIGLLAKAFGCIVLLIIVIVVPVTLKLTNVIGPVVVVTAPPTDAPSSMPSQSPSAMPSSVEFTEVMERLLPISGETLIDVGSPQYEAAKWIADDDPMQLDIYDSGFEQRYAMAVLYYSLDGDNWYSKEGWLSGKSECDWEYVGGPGCLDGCIDGKVCAFDFEYDWYGGQKGTLPDELSILTEIRYFKLSGLGKDVSGTIPSGIGSSWTKLTSFVANYNHLEGEFPFTSNPLLGTILVNGNRIGDDIGKIVGLESLSWIEAEDNNFSGTIPEAFTELRYLEKVKLTNNKLSGTIPDTWSNATLLENLVLSGNQLRGAVPPTLAFAPNLRKLELSRNLLSGSIPPTYYQMKNLEGLHIDGNNIGGSLSQFEEPLYLSIREFVINGNAFDGRFPVEQFEKTEVLNILALHENQLTGSITQNICQRLDESNRNERLLELSVDCDLIECTCCTCL